MCLILGNPCLNCLIILSCPTYICIISVGQGGVMMLKKTIAILLGSFLIAIGINYFLVPNHLINGGMIGVGLIANYAFGLKPGLTTIVVSIPLYIFAWFYFRSFFYNGLHGLLICSFFIDLFYPLSTIADQTPMFISALVGGLLLGTGVGLMLLVKVSTGGGDLLALMISKATSINVGLIILTIDIIVIFSGALTIRETEMIFYSFLMILIIGLTTYAITKRFGEH